MTNHIDKFISAMASAGCAPASASDIVDGADKHIAIEGDSAGLWYMGKSLILMAEADIVFFVDGYKEFRGCVVEKLCADSYGKLCVEFEPK